MSGFVVRERITLEQVDKLWQQWQCNPEWPVEVYYALCELADIKRHNLDQKTPQRHRRRARRYLLDQMAIALWAAKDISFDEAYRRAEEAVDSLQEEGKA
jgi:hypothetical protein